MTAESKEEGLTFQIGLSMAGAISAGAYTAGVMDYLTETLTKWEEAKQNGKEDVPIHEIKIGVMAGASAGGITSVLTSVAIQNDIPHVDISKRKDEKYKEENLFYNTWVNLTNRDMMKDLLSLDDIEDGEVISLLNSSFKDRLADKLIKQIPSVKPHKSFADDLDVIVTLSNLTGIPYHIGFKSNIWEEYEYHTMLHKDYGHFIIGPYSYNNDGKIPIDFTIKDNPNFDVLKSCTKATGAFPVGLAPRFIKRDSKYVNDHPLLNLEIKSKGVPIEKTPYKTLNVDGGLMNNEPFEITKKYILNRYPETEREKEEKKITSDTFTHTIILIDPFPGEKIVDETVEKRPRLIKNIIGSIISTMQEQLRFKPADIKAAYDEEDYSRFLIAPARDYDEELINVHPPIQGSKAIACGSLGGFGGFLDVKFREHDFYLGRRNCQRFLQHYFVVPEDNGNPIFTKGYSSKAKDKFRITKDDKNYLPIIPDLNYKNKAQEEKATFFPKYNKSTLDKIKPGLEDRIKKVVLNISDFGFLIKIGLKIALAAFKSAIADSILKTIKDNLIDPERPLIR
ncbi:MAG: patatin-like phospholipase family protein [Ignavibacteria bacterium]|jgi:predicted acylesterase/phospholipase RssA